jgi:hypothetical protein
MAKVFGDTEVLAKIRHENLLERIRPEVPAPDRFVDPTISAVTKRTEADEIRRKNLRSLHQANR